MCINKKGVEKRQLSYTQETAPPGTVQEDFSRLSAETRQRIETAARVAYMDSLINSIQEELKDSDESLELNLIESQINGKARSETGDITVSDLNQYRATLDMYWLAVLGCVVR